MSDELDRLKAMVEDVKGQTWDHSPNDIKAIKWAVAQIEAARTPDPARLLAAARKVMPWARMGSEVAEVYASVFHVKELEDAVAEYEAGHGGAYPTIAGTSTT